MTVCATGLRKVRFMASFAPSFVRPSVRTTPTLWRANEMPKIEKSDREAVGV